MVKSHFILLTLFFLLILNFAPRFGWNISYIDVTDLPFEGVYKENGLSHIVYSSGTKKIDISYKNNFSREFVLIVDNNKPHNINVFIDGKSIEEDYLNISTYMTINSDIVWKDSSGIFYRMYFFIILLMVFNYLIYKTYLKCKFKYRKLLIIPMLFLLLIIVLIALRIII